MRIAEMGRKMQESLKWPAESVHKSVVLMSSLLVLWLAQTHKECECLRISSIEVPAAVWNGSQVTLSCNYALAPDEQLYSVKWYKNYVEFYRFQPQATGEQPASGSALELGLQEAAGQVGQNLNLNQAAGAEETSARYEFELDGINLDLSKSNATQVHLRQVSLASEASFKCEVSADSPTFATVSAERQLKVYVLPRQKLALIDNSLGPASGSQQALATTFKPPIQSIEPPITRLQNNAKQLIYQLNDLVNFTCISAPSRPAARLSWLLNDEPIAAPHNTSSDSLAANSLALEASDISQELRPTSSELFESRSTLVLRLQTSHLKVLRKQTSSSPAQANQAATYSNSILPLKLSCVSRLSVQFSAEASVQVSNGKPAQAKSSGRRRNSAREFVNSLPLASSWIGAGDLNQLEAPQTGVNLRQQNSNQQINRLEDAGLDGRPFRWPPAGQPAERQQRFRPASLAADALTDAWIRPSEERASGAPASQENKRQSQRARQNVVWTQRQLRAQADHIERLVQRSRPNELDSPHIEARSMRRERLETPPPPPPPPSSLSEPEVGRDLSTASEPDDEERTTPSPHSIVISSNQFGLPPDTLAPSGGDPFSSRELSRDYELDEVVNFTCHPTLSSGNFLFRAPNELLRSVQIKWFINNQEISGNEVNAFDGERFHSDTSAAAAAASVEGRRGSSRTRVRPTSWLLVEFTASLMQLKELALKCRTIVEQPLIEYESAQVISLSASPFVQADLSVGQRAPARPSMFEVREPQQRQQLISARHQASPGAEQSAGSPGAGNSQQRHRANVIRMRQSQQTRSHSSASAQANLSLFCSCLLAVGVLIASQNSLNRTHTRLASR